MRGIELESLVNKVEDKQRLLESLPDAWELEGDDVLLVEDLRKEILLLKLEVLVLYKRNKEYL